MTDDECLMRIKGPRLGVVLCMTLAGVLSCATTSNTPASASAESNAAGGLNEGFAPESDQEATGGEGRFTVAYEVIDPSFGWSKATKTDGVLDDVVESLNQNFRLKRDLSTIFSKCAGALPDPRNAFYDPNGQKITFCYELVEQLGDEFRAIFDGDADQANNTADFLLGAMRFLFLHEIGHALIDINAMHLTGGREEIADEFATVFLVESDPKQGPIAAMNATLAFSKALAKGEVVDDSSMGDRHPLTRQRAISVFCWIVGAFGSDKSLEASATKFGVPKQRLRGCHEEWKDIRDAWDDSLRPYLKGGTPQ
jgi:hypothetical protein